MFRVSSTKVVEKTRWNEWKYHPIKHTEMVMHNHRSPRVIHTMHVYIIFAYENSIYYYRMYSNYFVIALRFPVHSNFSVNSRVYRKN